MGHGAGIQWLITGTAKYTRASSQAARYNRRLFKVLAICFFAPSLWRQAFQTFIKWGVQCAIDYWLLRR
jgi:hypothetical protein